MFGNAEAYERFMGRWSRLVAPTLREFGRVPNSGKVLDVGSGTGSLSFTIAEATPAVAITGIDPSSEYVAYAKSRNKYGDRVTFEIGDAQKLRFPDGAFSAAASLLVFNFIPDPLKAVREVARVTAPHGTVSAAVWDYGGRMEMLRVFWEEAIRTNPAGAEKLHEKHMPLAREGELEALWKKGGLHEVREEAIDIPMKFTSFDDYWEPYTLGQGPAGAYVRNLAAADRSRLTEALRKRLGSGTFTLNGRVWAVTGVRPRV